MTARVFGGAECRIFPNASHDLMLNSVAEGVGNQMTALILEWLERTNQG